MIQEKTRVNVNGSQGPAVSELKSLLKPAMSLDELGIAPTIVIDLIYRLLFNEGMVSIGRFAEVIKVHAQVIDEIVAGLKLEHLVEVAKTGNMGRLSYSYRLTHEGTNRARDALERSLYLGPAPVNMDVYARAILLQTESARRFPPQDVQARLKHLILPDKFDRLIGPAVNSGTSLFLYGPPGNGKTTIAEAIGKLVAGDEPIWMPYALTVGGQIIQIYDPLLHHLVELEDDTSEAGSRNGSGRVTNPLKRLDKRWAPFRRPVVMTGGELTMDALDLRYDPITKFYEAPLQLKANGGMFLIDDFGRQQMSPQQLLNRWIVPLESRIDFYRLISGQTLKIPFRQLIVFSTNLDPAELVDDAFLRRIQMKVEVASPDEKLFYQIFILWCQKYHLAFDKDSFLHLLKKWYRDAGRTMQAVHPRDIVKTVISICRYEGSQPRLTPELIDEACRAYFVDM